MSNSKMMAGFIFGAAAGTAVGYFLNSDRKDEVFDQVKEKARQVKSKAAELKGRVKEKVTHAGDELEKTASR